MPDAAGRIILVCKLKGGAGATTTCRELAVAAVAAGLQVALVDLDSLGRPHALVEPQDEGRRG